ncbi:Flavodoxin [Lachnospiraceae bacterium TWA4]|nr:Flavodoxin [Lachnospiraceae bacterium TWA4]
MAKNLVIYYSRKGENYVNGSLKQISKGNTEVVAEYIKDAVGADLFEVDTVKPYSESYMNCIDEAKKELQQNARPEIKNELTDISQYDNIVIAGPCCLSLTVGSHAA